MLDQLPFDISYQILLLVDPFDLVRWTGVSRSWRKLLSHPLILDGQHLHSTMIRRHFPSAVQKIQIRDKLDSEFPKPPISMLIPGQQHRDPSPSHAFEEAEKGKVVEQHRNPFTRPLLLSLLRHRANALQGKIFNRVNIEVPNTSYNELGVKCKYDAGFCLLWSEGNRSVMIYDLPLAGTDEMYSYTLKNPRNEKVLTATLGGGKLVTATLDSTEEFLHVCMVDLSDVRKGKMVMAAPLPVKKLRLPISLEDRDVLPEGHVPLLFGSTPLISTNGRTVAFSDSYVSKITVWDFTPGVPPRLLGTYNTAPEWRTLFDRLGVHMDAISSLPVTCGLYIPEDADDVVATVFVHEFAFKYFAIMPASTTGGKITTMKGISAPHDEVMWKLQDTRRVTFSVFESGREIFVRVRYDDEGPLYKLVRRRASSPPPPLLGDAGGSSKLEEKEEFEYTLEKTMDDFISQEKYTPPNSSDAESLESSSARLYRMDIERSSTDHFVYFRGGSSHHHTTGTGVLYSWEYKPLTEQIRLRALSVRTSSNSETSVTGSVEFNPWHYKIVAAQGDEQCMVLVFESYGRDRVLLRLVEFGEFWAKLSERSLGREFAVDLWCSRGGSSERAEDGGMRREDLKGKGGGV